MGWKVEKTGLTTRRTNVNMKESVLLAIIAGVVNIITTIWQGKKTRRNTEEQTKEK